MWLRTRGGAAVPLFLYLLHSVSGGYILTFPKKWIPGKPVQFCIAQERIFQQSDEITVQLLIPNYWAEDPSYPDFEYSGGIANLPAEMIAKLNLKPATTRVVQEEQVRPTIGTRHSCSSIVTLRAFDHYSEEVVVRFHGTIGGVNIDETRIFDRATQIFTSASALRIYETIIQTDKERYKPGEKVQFRVLTREAPNLRASTETYSRISVEDSSWDTIQEWVNVSNPTGLIHLEFQLDDELAEGYYRITTESPHSYDEKEFLVEEYVLPRFEITCKAPGYVLASDETLELEVCTLYTFGDPVSGTLAINVRARRYGDTNDREENFVYEVMGCKFVEISLDALLINEYENFVYSLSITVNVTEEGTGVVATEDFFVDVLRTTLQFQTTFEYPRLELPFFSSLRVYFNDGEPAKNEPMTVCSKRWVLPIEAQRMRQLTGCATIPPPSSDDSPMALCPEIVCQYVGTDNDGIPKSACFMALCRNITTDDSGVLRVTIPPHLFSDPWVEAQVEVRAANYPDLFVPGTSERYMMQPTTEIYLGREPYYSPSNSALSIFPDSLVLDCTSGSNIEVQLPVMYSATGSAQVTLYVQVVSWGEIKLWKTLDVVLSGSNIDVDDETLIEPMMPVTGGIRRGVFNLPLTMPPSGSEIVAVLIWYTREDGEVVSDEQKLYIGKCPNYAVELSWPSERVHVGAELPLTLTAEPNALCSVGVKDRSASPLFSTVYDPLFNPPVSLLGGDRNRVHQIDDFEHCLKRTSLDDFCRADSSRSQGRQQQSRTIGSESSPSFAFRTDHVDAIKFFDDAGLFVISDLTLETRPCRRESDNERANRIAVDTCEPKYTIGLSFGTSSNGEPTIESFLVPSLSLCTTGIVNLLIGNVDVNAGPVTPAIEVKTRLNFPETWLWELHTIPASGVYSENLTLPDTVTEWVGRAVCVHPDKGIVISDPISITTIRAFFIDLTLPPSVKVGEILPVKISVFNYFSTSVSVRVTLERRSEYEILEPTGTEAAADQAAAGERSACVPSEDNETVVVRIRFLEAGPVNITVSAEVVPGLVDSCDSGNPTNGSDRIITPIAVDYEGFVRETSHSLYYCTNSTTNYDGWTLTAPSVANIVNNSVRAWITATGDLIGSNLENPDWLIRMPYGCGEQNLARFAPNIYILQYLERTQQFNATVTENLIEYINRGYQQQLSYQRSDESFSAFGSRDQYGSTWLTAFVMKTLEQANKYISGNSFDIIPPIVWLLFHIRLDGCFQGVGYVHNRIMKGGLGEDSAPAALTAYVMAALLEWGLPADFEFIINATVCVEAATAAGAIGENDVYLLALKAYAFSLAGLPQTIDVIDDLLTRSEESSDGTFWRINSHSGFFSPALSVETTSYVLMAMIKSNYTDPQDRKLRLLKWILSQRNGYGGFISTQDTVVALQALALFGSPVPDAPFDAAVTFSWSSGMETLQVTEGNKFLLQRFDVETIPAQIDVEFSGDGCIFVDGVVRYNVVGPDLSDVFTVSVTTRPDYGGAVCQSNVIRVCATYDPIDIESNMAIIELNLVSGYLPDVQDLDRIVSDATGPIKRYDVDGSQVIFYVDHFGNSQICVEFTAFEDAEVELTASGTVRVYDYYEPNFYVSEVFQFSRLFCP